MHLNSGVCITYYVFLAGPMSPMRRSADILTSHCSLTLSVPVVSSFSATLHVLIYPQISKHNVKATLAPLPRDWNCPSG